ncbi:peptidylprolyl isomerase [Teredinibacter turnerae]|uniref:FKBP-type peptidyl-prolyl cis-trans isomerase n=1 Tax=Teredinibacter turnerae TaxID=2426 RepID=UPI00037B11D3|nr:peptidylprolyl isomerase [Teredinibacter turnerae]
MKIQDNCVVSIHYTLTDEEGAVIDSSSGGEPLNYLAGAGNIIPGLEKELAGCVVGDSKQVTVQPAEGYGEYQPELVQTLPAEMFTGIEKVEVGMEFQAQGPSGEVQFVVVKDVADEGITIDGNHELAGKVLNFDVTVESVREATAEELDHGHVH